MIFVTGAVLCLTLNIYHEARGEPELGQYKVAMVTLERAKKNKDVCGTVFARKQFSWANGKVTKVNGGYLVKPELMPAKLKGVEWEVSKAIALNALSNQFPMQADTGATHYHRYDVNPGWKGMVEIARVGKHIFYKKA